LLKNYRNYSSLELNFDNKVNVFIGLNAQGKTNLMESIHVLAFAKSHRTTNDKELIKWDEEYAKIEGSIQKRNSTDILQLILSKKGKKARVNLIEKARLSEYVGNFNVVMFAPEDLNLVKGSPQVRRKFIDMELGQISPVYIYNLSTYQKVLLQRNNYLKKLSIKETTDLTTLDILTEQMVELAAKIVDKRLQFITLLENWAKGIHSDITNGIENLSINYKSSINVSEKLELSKMIQEYYDYYEKNKEREIYRGVTLFGPHRDDLELLVNSKDVQIYGSQGQQRTVALSLKLAEIELIKTETNEYPVLLLDDVLSELDNSRQTHLLDTIQNKVQTFVTTTNIDGIDHKVISEAKIFKVKNANIEY
jgi:DNA replication and repair protein RecF